MAPCYSCLELARRHFVSGLGCPPNFRFVYLPGDVNDGDERTNERASSIQLALIDVPNLAISPPPRDRPHSNLVRHPV